MPEGKMNQLWARYFKKKKDLEVREELAKIYFPLVEVEARRLLARLPLRVYWEKKEDIQSAGVIGLLQALDFFIPPKEKRNEPGRAFEAYARYRIRGQMVDELRNLDFARRNLRKQARAIQEAEKKLQARLGRLPRDEETAKVLGIPLDEFYEWVAEINMLNLLSLDAEIGEGGVEGRGWADLLADAKAENPLDKVEKQEKIEKVAVALRDLGVSEQEVLHLYYVENLTFKEIGQVLKVSESRICQIHHMAIFRLQELLDEEGGSMVGPKDVNGYTTITTESDGVYLTVFPPSGSGGRVTLEDVKKELVKYNINPDDSVVLNQAVQLASGKPQKISDAKVDKHQEQIFVEISEDEMTAKLTIVPPQSDSDHFVSIDDVRGTLQRRGVAYGLDETRMAELSAKLAQLAETKTMNEPIEREVAFGTPVVNGEDARVEYLFKKPTEEEQKAPVFEETEDGRVDYRSIHKIENILKGTVLARKIPHTKGMNGMTVTGKVIEAKDGKDIDIVIGKGVAVSPENKDEWIADTDGQVITKDNKISVMALYEIPGDINLAVGNVDFIGTVIVRGDVKDGFKVFAGEDLIINGVVEGAELKCGGKLTIAGGVSGNDKAKISCPGDATIKYIRNATIDVGGSLTCAQAIMHSKVVVGKKVTVAGRKGVIVGGQVIAGYEINAASVGSAFATPTELVAGEAIGLREELQKLEHELKAATENLDKTKKGVQFLKDQQVKMGGNLPPEKKELLTKLTRALFKLVADTKTLAEKKQDLEKKDQEAAEDRRRHAKITCMGIIHTGVKVIINKVSRHITEELKYCTMTESGGEVRVGPYRGT